MVLYDLPFVGVECAGLIQDVRMHCKLADVVEKCRPPQTVPIRNWEVQFVGDQVRVCPNPLAVAPCEPVMSV
jgi:hypothetical protein